MAMHGDVIMQACAIAIESLMSNAPSANANVACKKVQFYTLRVMGCIAGAEEESTVQKYLYDNEALLQKVTECLKNPDEEVG